MKKSILWLIIVAFIIKVGYLASLSDPPLDESIKFVDIESYLSKQQMANDIDSLTFTFQKVHPNPYRFFEKSQMLSKIDSIKKELPDSLSTLNFWRVIDQIIIGYNDAHSKVEDAYVLTDYVKHDKLFFPLSASISNNKIHVLPNENSEQVLPEGSEIKQINGKTDKEIIRDVLKHATRETPSLKQLEISDDFGFYLWKTYDWDSDFRVHYTSHDSTNSDSIVFNGIKWEDRKTSAKGKSQPYAFKWLNDTVGYMNITDFNGDENDIEHFYKQSFTSLLDNNASDLILDFRGHTGGADRYGENLAKYFAKAPFKKLSKAYWKITPEFKEAFDRKFVPKGIRWFKPIYLVNEYSSVFYGAESNELVTVNYKLKEPLPPKERFHGNVYLITDHHTFSAGSIFAEMFKFYKMGQIIGHPTGNLYSFNGFALTNFTLPHSKLSFQVSSVYNIANNEELGMKSVEPNDTINIEKDPLKYIIETYIR